MKKEIGSEILLEMTLETLIPRSKPKQTGVMIGDYKTSGNGAWLIYGGGILGAILASSL